MKIICTFLFLSFSVWPALSADIVTIGTGSSYSVKSNEVAEVISVSSPGTSGASAGSFFYRTSTATNVFHAALYNQNSGGSGGIISTLPTPLAGPGEITGNFTALTIRIRTKAEYLANFTVPNAASSTSVVIPEDAAGPVTIVLESSTDLVNWTAANPGTYGSSTAKRFFRVRAIVNGN